MRVGRDRVIVKKCFWDKGGVMVPPVKGSGRNQGLTWADFVKSLK